MRVENLPRERGEAEGRMGARRTTSAESRTVVPGSGRALARLARHVEGALAPLDLSLPQYRVLSLLSDGSSASSALAHRLAVSPPSVTAVVDVLVARGLVEREPDPGDRRRLTLILTADGSTSLRAAEDAIDARVAAIAGFLEDPESAIDAIAGLQQWNHALDDYREEKRQRTEGPSTGPPAP